MLPERGVLVVAGVLGTAVDLGVDEVLEAAGVETVGEDATTGAREAARRPRLIR
ncbi:hypothetical protein [Halopseudomonas oceani]|uniref:hypothetical protein n=1 Tax=Halopseudomonas oceani TaxID=1708783 RepID=UPI003899655F